MATLVQKSDGSNAINNNSAPAVIVTGNQNSVIETSTGGLGAIEVKGPDSTHAAFMTFHRPGVYATYFGLDTDNMLKVGGWSMGAAKQRVFHGIADGSAPVFACRAWVNFNAAGVMNGSGNVSSVTKGATGSYTVNLGSALIDTNYSVIGSARRGATDSNMDFSPGFGTSTLSTSAIAVFTRNSNVVVLEDPQSCFVAIFR